MGVLDVAKAQKAEQLGNNGSTAERKRHGSTAKHNVDGQSKVPKAEQLDDISKRGKNGEVEV